LKNNALVAIAGFTLLFTLYHAAEYQILFRNSPLSFLAFQFLFFIAAYFIAKWQGKQGLAAWGLAIKKPFLKHLLPGMLMGAALYGTTYGLSLLLAIEHVAHVPGWYATIAPLSLFVFGNFFSSFSEDILTRGYVHNHLQGRVRNWVIILASAAVYLLNHIYRLDDGFITLAYLFLLGVLFVIPLILTKRLWFTGGMHWIGNVTFYYTHEIVKTEQTAQQISPNHILIFVILLFIPLNYLALKAAQLIEE